MKKESSANHNIGIDKKKAIEIAEKYLLEDQNFSEYLLLRAEYDQSGEWLLDFDPHPLEGVWVVGVNAETGEPYLKEDTTIDLDFQNQIIERTLVVASLDTEIECPHCGNKTSERLSFQWGLCLPVPSRLTDQHQIYRLNEKIRWRCEPDGTIPPWTVFLDGACNIGDPLIENLLLYNYGLYEYGYCRKCKKLSHLAAVIEIRQGAVSSARLVKPGEFDEDVYYYTVENGIYHPHPEWIKPEMEKYIKGSDA